MSGPGVPASPAADLSELLTQAAAASPDRTALVEASGRRMTWAELDEEVDRLAAGLGAAGVLGGHRVMLAMGNRIEMVAGYLAVLRVQAVAVPVNPGSTPDELGRMLADCGARLLFADQGTVVSCRAAISGLDRSGLDRSGSDRSGLDRAVRLVVVGATLRPGERGYDQLRIERGRPVPPLLDPEKLAALLYTSGTSGRPRAAMLTHRALLANLEQLATVTPELVTGDDVVLGVLPLFHVYGLNAVLGAALRHRARLVLAARFDPQATLDLIDDEACSVLPLAPAVFAAWQGLEGLRERLGSVRLVVSGSAPLPVDVTAAFTAATGLAVHQGYGLTEAAPVVTSTVCSPDLDPGSASVGAALPGVELRLDDGAGRPPAPGDPGEIWLRGRNLFSGYWPAGDDGPDADGWWPTGDVGLLDGDGDLFLVDRLRELVIVSGFNVYPVEVEAVVREVAGVAGAAVIGVDDPATGEAVVAYVVAQADTSGAAELESAVAAHCASRLARFKRPTRIEVVAELPVGVTGKVQKGRLRGLERRRRAGLLR